LDREANAIKDKWGEKVEEQKRAHALEDKAFKVASKVEGLLNAKLKNLGLMGNGSDAFGGMNNGAYGGKMGK
jgi:hypothetical protein